MSDGDACRGLRGCARSQISERGDRLHIKLSKLVGMLAKALQSMRCVSKRNLDSSSGDGTSITQSAFKCFHTWRRRHGSARPEHADAPHALALRRVRRERPRSSTAAERDELALSQLIEFHLSLSERPRLQDIGLAWTSQRVSQGILRPLSVRTNSWQHSKVHACPPVPVI